MTEFVHLNIGWNANPNAPNPQAAPDGDDLVLGFGLNYFAYENFAAGEKGYIRFQSCTRYRFNSVNDEGWYQGQCRFSKLAPKWGEFYEVIGDFEDQKPVVEWISHATASVHQRNFLFYFRDNTFECSAGDWSIEKSDRNALNRPPS